MAGVMAGPRNGSGDGECKALLVMTQDLLDGRMHGLRVIERLRQQQHQACEAIALRGDVGQVGQCDRCSRTSSSCCCVAATSQASSQTMGVASSAACSRAESFSMALTSSIDSTAMTC